MAVRVAGVVAGGGLVGSLLCAGQVVLRSAAHHRVGSRRGPAGRWQGAAGCLEHGSSPSQAVRRALAELAVLQRQGFAQVLGLQVAGRGFR